MQAAGIQLELLTGPLTRIYDPNGLGALLFAVLTVSAQLDRDYVRDKTLEGQSAAAARGRHGGRPRVFDNNMLAFALALRAKGVGVPEIAAKLRMTSARTGGSRRRWRRCTGRWPRPTSVARNSESRTATQVRSRGSGTAAIKEDSPAPELPVTLDMPGKVADFLRACELDPAEQEALDQGVTVRRDQGYTLRVSAAPAVYLGLLARCQPLDGGHGVPTVPAQRKARREYENRVSALTPAGP
ncbi:hypothetical protein AB0L06_40590 [Spirillospora sp. NPDC052269]